MYFAASRVRRQSRAAVVARPHPLPAGRDIRRHRQDPGNRRPCATPAGPCRERRRATAAIRAVSASHSATRSAGPAAMACFAGAGGWPDRPSIADPWPRKSPRQRHAARLRPPCHPRGSHPRRPRAETAARPDAASAPKRLAEITEPAATAARRNPPRKHLARRDFGGGQHLFGDGDAIARHHLLGHGQNPVGRGDQRRCGPA